MTCQQRARQTMYDLSTESQTDRVCLGRKFRRSLQDGCAKRGADVASDHYLLIAKLKFRLKRNWTGDSCQRPQYDTTMLLNDTTKQQECKIVLLNKFQVLEELLEEKTINGRQSKSHSQRKLWVRKSNTTKMEEINNSRTPARKARDYEEYSHTAR